jgi:hypothetical protein
VLNCSTPLRRRYQSTRRDMQIGLGSLIDEELAPYVEESQDFNAR